MKIPSAVRLAALALLSFGLTACTHLSGEVLSDRGHPVPGAQFTIGRPDMLVMDRHYTDGSGHFDFYISPLDETNVYLWDGKGDPTVGVIHLDHLHLSTHMILHMQDPNNPFAAPP